MISETLYSSRSEDWATPQDFFDKLNDEFNFTLDPCSSEENHKCPKYYTKEQDGLNQNWDGERVFMNPPYGKTIARWMEKAVKTKGTVVVLVHSRTDTRWWHNWVEPYADEVRFVKGRLKFGGSKFAAPFPSAVVIYLRTEDLVAHENKPQVS